MKKFYLRYRIGLLLCLSFACSIMSFVFAENDFNVNTLSIGTSSTITGRYFCTQTFDVIANYNGGSGFSNCQYVIKFNPLNETLSYVQGLFPEHDTGYVLGNLLFAEEKSSDVITGNKACSRIQLAPIATTMTSTNLIFVDRYGNIPTDDTFNNTDDKLNLSYGGADTLTGVQNLTINYEICPCTLDTKDPVFSDFSPNISNANLTGQQTISFLIYDQGGTSWNYWSNGQPVSLSNYTGVGVPSGMDNQEGINSGSITVTIHYDSRYGVADETLTLANGGLHVVRYTGTKANIPAYTWDGNDRGYRVTFTPSTGFLPEYPVTITISGSDNVLNNGAVCSRPSQNAHPSYTINNSVSPTITFTNPGSGASNLNPNVSDLVFRVADSWAGVDTGTVRITIPAIYSGSQLLMTGYIYSGSELEFSNCSGTPELGGGYSCDVIIHPKWDFPVATGVMITGYVADLAGNSNVGRWQISTRQDCSFYGCINYVQIFTGVNVPVVEFTGSLIVVTGTVLPYPILTGENNNILMCGPTDTEINLTGSINIYSGDVMINGTAYEGTGLYITGLNFEYEDGVITVLFD